MYKPNFCCDCGTKLLRLRWHFWTSRRFCDECARRLRRQRFVPWLWLTLILTGAGFVAGRAVRPSPPPLTIIRRADSPLTSPEDPGPAVLRTGEPANANANANTTTAEEEVYLCGARTKKGTPCSRRVHRAVRCWQHKGMPSMIPVVPIK
jgi:hypothetical protein